MVNCKKIFSSIFIFSIPFLMCGCSEARKEATIYEDGFFKYIHLGDNSKYQDPNDRSLVIVGFTDSGLQEEFLDIPREINGFGVKRIGLKDSDFKHLDDRKIKCSDNLKKIFVQDNIQYIEELMCPNVDVFLNSKKSFLKDYVHGCKNVYLYKPLFIELGYPEMYASDSNITRHYLCANVSFMMNLPTGENDLYRIDNVSNGERITKPSDPSADGYEFKGWYTSSECIDIFNFETIPAFNEKDEIVFYAGWNIL